MTKRVEYEGRIHEFPDDFTDDEISASLMTSVQEAPAPQPAARVQPSPSPGVTPVQRASTMLRGLMFNLNDEAGGATAGLLEGGRAALEGDIQNMAPRARSAYDTQAQRIRGLTEDYQRQQPVGAVADELAGAVPTMGLGMLRATQAPGAGQRAAPRMMEQIGRGGLTGAAFGYGYGAADQGSLRDRLGSANRGAGYGAAFGAAAPPLVTGAQLAVRAAGERLPRISVDPNRLGTAGGNLRIQPRRQPPRPPSGPLGRALTLADRARLTPEALSQRAGSAPEQSAVVDLFGDAGVRTLRPMVQAPGRTGDLAADVAERRFAEAPARIISALRKRLQVGESRTQALQRLEAEYETAAANLYNPLWRNPTTDEQRAIYEQQIVPLFDDPLLKDAAQRAEQIFAREVRLGRMTGNIDDHLGRYLHLIKMGLDAAVQSGKRNPQGIQATELAGVNALRARFRKGVDAVVPGYREARSQWAGLADAEDALDTGAAWVKMLPDEVAASRAQMTPFELQHARIGLADEISRMTAGVAVGHRNVANALNGRDMQMAIANAFDTPEQAAEFLGTVNDTNRLLRSAHAWGAGSQTQGNQAYEANNVLAAAADLGGDLIAGRWGQALNRTGRQIGNLAMNNIVERSNNAFGEELLRPATADEAQAFVAEVVRVMRQREATRTASDLASRAAGAGAGQQGASRRRD